MNKNLYPPQPVLLVDDDENWLHSLAFTLEYSAGISHIIRCPDSRNALTILKEHHPSVVVIDLNMPHFSGEELLDVVRQEQPETPVIVISGMNLAETAVRCLKGGAFDYYVKTTEPERLIAGIRNALSLTSLQKELQHLAKQFMEHSLVHPESFSEIITRNRRMLDLFRYVEAISSGREPILITGESGVGKELFARAIHRLSRQEVTWVAVNVAGLDDHAFSDTLFGHVKGAFTGAERPRGGMIERAAGGTLFLDEIGDLNPASQVKLLRLLQEREYFPLGSDTPRRMSARIVCATNQDLPARHAAGSFRKDLFYRLRTHHLHIPPLRERREDIPLLAEHFLEKAAAEFGRKKPALAPAAAELLLAHDFPGNVRELRGVIYDVVGSDDKEKITSARLCKALSGSAPPQESDDPRGAEVHFGIRLPTLEESADLLVEEALRRCGGNQTAAAKILGISQPGLSKRLRKTK